MLHWNLLFDESQVRFGDLISLESVGKTGLNNQSICKPPIKGAEPGVRRGNYSKCGKGQIRYQGHVVGGKSDWWGATVTGQGYVIFKISLRGRLQIV